VTERCATCKHWLPPTENDYGLEHRANKMGVRRCGAAPMFEDSYELVPDESEEGGVWVIPAKLQATTAFVQDGSSYQADLFTRAEHGCTMHETVSAKEE